MRSTAPWRAAASRCRIILTLAHEFWHYLLHRADYRNGVRCGEQKRRTPGSRHSMRTSPRRTNFLPAGTI
jgi:hypothetical protein